MYFKFLELVIISLLSMLGQINNENNIDGLKEELELSKQLLNSITIVATDGKVEPDLKDNSL